jgi:hypothetical protein
MQKIALKALKLTVKPLVTLPGVLNGLTLVLSTVAAAAATVNLAEKLIKAT